MGRISYYWKKKAIERELAEPRRSDRVAAASKTEARTSVVCQKRFDKFVVSGSLMAGGKQRSKTIRGMHDLPWDLSLLSAFP